MAATLGVGADDIVIGEAVALDVPVAGFVLRVAGGLIDSFAGAVFGFPLFTSVAMRHVEAVHASVMLGVLPLATALVGAWANRQRPSAGFWACAVLGSALVMVFAVLKSGAAVGNLSIHWADGLLLAAMAWGGLAYVAGVRFEYGHVPDEAWRPGRARVLQSFLDRPRLYATTTMHDEREHRARANLGAELSGLR